MRQILLSVILIFGLAVPIGAGQAQTANTVSATCKDGSTFSGASRSGACRGHGGVKTWGTAATAPSGTSSPTAATGTPSSPATSTAPVGNGQVWVNTASNVYHCPGTRWYGKTKKGEYMSEAQAKAQGARPGNGKTCGS
jgi:hypothetical protein